MSNSSRSYLKVFFVMVFIAAAVKSICSQDLIVGMIFVLGGVSLGCNLARDHFRTRRENGSSSEPL